MALPSIDKLFSAVQENCSPALWSHAVQLTRNATSFSLLSVGADECLLHIKPLGRALSHKVTLWPTQEDWDCDCGSTNNPCEHVAAAVIELKKGTLSVQPKANSTSADQSLGEVPKASTSQILYRFKRSKEGLTFVREISGTPRTLTSLSSYIGGQQSGRVDGPELLATTADFNVDRVLNGYTGGPLDRTRIEGLFRSLESDQAILLDQTAVHMATEVITVRAECVDEGEGYRIRRIKNPSISEVFPQGVALCESSGGFTLKLIALYNRASEEAKWIDGDGSYWAPAQENDLLTKVIPALKKKISLDIKSIKLPQVLELTPRVELILENGTDPKNPGTQGLSVVAQIVYGDPPLAMLNYHTLELAPVKSRAHQKIGHIIARDTDKERQLIMQLAQALNLQPGRRVFFEGQAAVDFAQRTKTWNPIGSGVATFIPSERLLKANFQFDTNSTLASQFDVEFYLASDGDDNGSTGATSKRPSVSFEKVFRAWQNGDDHVPLLDGQWAKLPADWMQKFGKKIHDFLLLREANRTIPAYRIPELAALADSCGVKPPIALEKLRSLLEDHKGIKDYPLPEDLQATLRSYQKEGVNWLCFLREAGLGALLADDMGLGKTLQTICVLPKTLASAADSHASSLVVAPTSVLFNWEAEIRRFRPGLRVGVYYGPKREFPKNCDVVLTSYGVLRLDQELLAAQNWDTIVVDEAQTIKNPDSQIAKAVHALGAKFRIALSGTPVENRLDDLWSQFEFLNPGLLATREKFLDEIARPIVRGDAEAVSRLRTRIRPFILRRLKKDVAAELPPRIENVLQCELRSDERALYDGLFATTKTDVVKKIESGGSVLEALEVILRLRQACCHSALIPGQFSDTPSASSKIELLLETLDESLAEGHKSLVFSQWTSFLDLIETSLKEKNIPFGRIDGSTRDRQKEVGEFQSPGGPPVMLISLKAGGVGLNLTAADHVFIMDPWWNPAVEDQAADRAHRIGQQNTVLIHRLVARDTIEERILELQSRKKDLARAVLEGGAASLGLSRDDVLDLLR